MFKKNTWIAVLLVALVMMFVSCIDAVVEEEGDIVEIFRLSKVIADVEDGVLDGDEGWNAVFADTPLAKCGPATFSIITEGGKKKLQIGNMINTWGEGLDICNQAGVNGGKNSGVGFRAGDKITLKGWTDHSGMYMNAKGGAHGDTDNWMSPGGDFEHELTLTTAIVGTIRQGNPQVIRLHYHNNVDRKGTIKFEEIVVEGPRSSAEDVYEDDFEISDRLKVFNWVATGLTITPKKGKTDGAITQYYEGIAPVVYAKSTTLPTALGDYNVTFDVAAAKGFNAATGLSAGKMRILRSTPPARTESESQVITFTGQGVDNGNGDWIPGPDGKPWFFLYNGGPDCTDATPAAFTGQYTAGASRYGVNLADDWADFETITVVYDAVFPSFTTQKSVLIRSNHGPGFNAMGNHNIGADAGAGDVHVLQIVEGTNKEYTMKAEWIVFDNNTPVTTDDADGFSLTMGNAGNGVLIRIKAIKYGYAE